MPRAMAAGTVRQSRTKKVMLAAGVFFVGRMETLASGQDQDVVQGDGLSRDTLGRVKGRRLGWDADRGEFVRRRERGIGRDWEVGIGLKLKQNRPLAPGITTKGRIGLRDRREIVERSPSGK